MIPFVEPSQQLKIFASLNIVKETLCVYGDGLGYLMLESEGLVQHCSGIV